ncbi:LuxR C-terminal-related transcriptional regulator [Dactylosporangium sp. NPDC051484]|uniref:helix-turn-helix transcriptional regulator n=1 Tax=Dactylosporangium sp. NPDC051484 TaxID=3154942 RepID=UPI00344F9CC7
MSERGRDAVVRAFAALLLDREPQLAAIAERLGRVRRDGAALVMLTGTGRSRLLAEAARRAGPDVTVLATAADELDQDVRLGAARRLLGEPPAADAALPARMRELTGIVRERAAQRPVLLCLDDAHWADPATLRWLGHLLRRCADRPVGVVLAYRADRRSPRPDAFDEWAGDPRVSVERLAPLSPAAVAALVGEALGPGDAEFAAACHRHTAGNPKLLRALLCRLADTGTVPRRERLAAVEAAMEVPAAVLVTAFLRDRATRTAGFARAAAALGDGTACERIAAVAGVEPAAAAGIARELADADLTEERDGGLWFRHPLVPAAFLAQLSDVQRSALHEHAARVLEQAGAPAEEVARHLLHVPPRDEPWIARRLCEAADGELGRGAPGAAADFLRRALAQPLPAPARGDVLLRLGAAASVTHPDQAAWYLSMALSESAAGAVNGLAEPAGLLLPDILAHAGRAAEAVGVLDDLLGRLDPADPAAEVFAAHRLLVARESTPQAAAAPPAPGPPGRRAYSGALALITAARPDGRVRATALAQQALATGVPAPAGLPSALAAAATLMYADLLDEAESWLDRIIDAARRQRAPLLWSKAIAYRARCAYRRGDLAVAAAEAERSLALLASGGGYRFQLFALPTLLRCRTEQDRLDEAAALAEGPWPAAFEAAPQWSDFLYARGLLRLARQDPRGCLDDLIECGRSRAAWGIDNPAWLSWRTAAVRACLLLGDGPRARALAAEEEALARQWGTPRLLGAAEHTGALVAGDDALARLEEAVRILEPAPARLDLARALVDLGGEQIVRQQRKPARETLRRALELAQECESARTAERAHRQLLLAGARPRRLVFSGVAALTRAERQVAELAAEGLTNREIAERLHVTQRTVELHLTRVYRKTGVPGRAGLAAVLAADPTG